MKLRNKKTGEIKELQEIMHDAFIEHNEKSLMNLEKDWEDYKEPKEYWHIDFDGDLMPTSDIKCDKHVFDKIKEIGNYFDTREEAEQAVEKLKAWKRLKDEGFRFNGGGGTCINCRMELRKWDDGLINDFDLLFGGEE